MEGRGKKKKTIKEHGTCTVMVQTVQPTSAELGREHFPCDLNRLVTSYPRFALGISPVNCFYNYFSYQLIFYLRVGKKYLEGTLQNT